uniref:BTB domain-containing protein n=1 Tax=Syphacia muris TaxID=451379 RepID=A0A0N5ATC7_9BILA
MMVPKRFAYGASCNDDPEVWCAEQSDHNEDYTLILRDPEVGVKFGKDILLRRLNAFRKNRDLCDVVLFVGEKEILAHKVVLAALSPALLDLFIREDDNEGSPNNSPPVLNTATVSNSPKTAVPFGSPLKLSTAVLISSSKQPLSYFEFPEADYTCFEALVEFAYTSSLEISSKKVGELYKTAFLLQMTPVVKACAQFLAQNLNVTNCIGIRKQANFNNDVMLVGKVDSFISNNFQQVIDESPDFTQLPCIKVRIIVNLEDVKGRFGLNLAELALNYFQSLPTYSDRVEQVIEQLSEKAHMLYLEEDQTLQDCAEMDDHSSVGSCDIIQDYKKTGGYQSRTTGGMMKYETCIFRTSVGTVPVQHHVMGAKAVHLNASRISNNRFSSTESLNSVSSTTSEMDEEIQSRLIAVHQTSGDFWVALCVLHRKLVTLSLQLTENDDIVRTNRGTNVWNSYDAKQPTDVQQQAINDEKKALLARIVTTPLNDRVLLPSMSGARCSVGAAFISGKIIVCGGYDRGECMKSTEEYDVCKSEWRQLPDMISERGRFDATVASGMLYAVAGSNGNNDLKSAECYDPKTEKWRQIKALKLARSHNGCATLDNLVYCIGGSSEQTVLKECERYDPETDEWKDIAPLQTARFQTGCTAWRGMVVACGGCDRWTCLDSVEAFDPKTDSWKVLPKLKTPRRGCAVAVVRDSLYVIGGHDGTQSLSSVEILDHPNGQWRIGPSLLIPRANTHAAVTAGNVIFVIGGFDGTQFLSSIEVLDNESLGWRNWQQVESGSRNEVAITEEDEKCHDSIKEESKHCDEEETGAGKDKEVTEGIGLTGSQIEKQNHEVE